MRVSKSEKAEAIAKLQEMCPPGSKVYCSLRHVSRSEAREAIMRIDAAEVAKVAAAAAFLPDGEAFRLSPPNAKTKALCKSRKLKPCEFYSLSILSGISCPGAKDCKAWAKVGPDGKRTIERGQGCEFQCFAASDEACYDETYKQREHNRALILKYKHDTYALAALLLRSIPSKARLIRVHIGGDFFCQSYLDAWVLVALSRPSLHVYAYTKSLHFVLALEASAADLPANLALVLSEGGMFDHLLAPLKALGFRSARVVFSEAEAKAQGLEVDHTDDLAAFGKANFALLLHGTQPAGSKASKAIRDMQQAGVKFGYVRNPGRK